MDFREVEKNHFPITLPEGCFGPLVRIPKTWHDWEYQPTGAQNGWWVAFWLTGETRPRGPFGPEHIADFDTHYGFFRMQGHGDILLYSNDVVPTSNSTATPTTTPFEAKTPPLVRLDVRSTDPHICAKPDTAYYDNAFQPGFGHDQFQHQPLNFLFDTKHLDRVISWSNGFTGTVPICFIIDGDGTPKDLRFVQSPGKEIEDHVRDYISGWRYQPAMYKDAPFPVQVAFNFVFP